LDEHVDFVRQQRRQAFTAVSTHDGGDEVPYTTTSGRSDDRR